jgi:phosphopantetheinyl transferase
LQHGIRLLHSGECDLAVIGAMHTGHSEVFWSAFNLMGAMSKRGVIAPFSRDADGLVIGQGGGFVCLKTLERAEADNDRIYAVVKGAAVGSDGAGSSVLVTNKDGQRRVLEAAWAQSGLDPEQVGYVETHGTGTPVGDATELQTLTGFFGGADHRQAYLGSVKSNIGHLMPAAGMIGLVKTVLALHHRQIPPTLHCEDPLPAMAESRFDPAQELIDWEASGLPLVAGVNSFGFGGVNAHAVLTAYEPPVAERARYRADKRRGFWPDVMVLAAPTKEAMLSRVDLEHFESRVGPVIGAPEDPYRLVIFDPTNERMRLAADIVRRDRPWRGRSDIWFTNQPLLHNDGKVVFMFPGFSLSELVEHESIEDELGLACVNYEGINKDDQDIGDFFYTSLFVHEALLRTGVTADLYTGHSIGEWHAARACGILDESFDQLNMDFGRNPAYKLDPSLVPEFRTVVVTAQLDADAWDRVLAVPDVVLSNDNCPSQVVLTVLSHSLSAVLGVLDEEHAFYQILPFASGLHTRYIAPIVDTLVDAMSAIPIHASRAPLWSAITLDQVSTTKTNKASEIFADELTQPVRFRQLVTKLYDEQKARIFIQVGSGILPGFVDDTLKGREFASAAAVVSTRNAVDQLRRVHALMFVEGGPADLTFMGVRPEMSEARSFYLLPEGSPFVPQLDTLNQAVQHYYQPAGTAPTAPAADSGGALADLSGVPNPVVQALDDNLRQAVRVQGEVVQRFKEQGLLDRTTRSAVSPRPAPVARSSRDGVRPAPAGLRLGPTGSSTGAGEGTPPAPAAAACDRVPVSTDQPQAGAAPKRRRGTKFELPFDMDLKDYPYLVDHSIVNQPVDWPRIEDFSPVVPLTLTMELLAEIAMSLAPGLKVAKISSVMAMNFIPLHQPFHATLKGFWKSDYVVSFSIDGHIMMDITLAAELTGPPPFTYAEFDAQLGRTLGEPISPEYSYKQYAFHRSAYQPTIEMVRFAEKGFLNVARKAAGKASLLDAMGQDLGLYLHLREVVNQVSFPIRVDELRFYTDMFDQAGTFRTGVIVRNNTHNFITGDMIFERDGQVWATARGWVNQRLPLNPVMWGVNLQPETNVMAREIAPNVHYFNDSVLDRQGLAFVYLRYLDDQERIRCDGMAPDQQKSFVFGRVALKDAVRSLWRDREGLLLYPIAITTWYDEDGRPHVRQRGGPARPELHVSVAHKPNQAVAIVADHPVGIDLEHIVERDQGFLDLAFTATERERLLSKGNAPEWVTRFWVAKEAYGKFLGVGLAGNPKRYEVDFWGDDDLVVAGTHIKTMVVDEQCIIGWTD